jgi:beta-lactam-binding protein with PASTA domain
VRRCPRCGREHADDVHFCSCGAFLDWDPPAEADVTGARGSPEATPVTVIEAAPPAAGVGELVSLVLFRPDQPVDGAPVTLVVPAGGRTTLVARVRNQSTIVDSYELHLHGLPEGWWTIDPPTPYLLPLGSREGYEDDVVIAIHPPRSPAAEARRWTFTVGVKSQSHPTRVAHAAASVDVEPFWQVAAAARPAVVTARRRATLFGEVTNEGNAPVAVALTAVDAEERCRFALPAQPAMVAPGAAGAVPVVVRPKRPLLIGRPLDHRLELLAQTEGEVAPAAQFFATYRQRPWIRWWVPLLLLLLVVAAVLVYLLWPDRVDVPDVRKQRSAFAAQKILEREGLTLNPKVGRKPKKGVRAGSVIDQAPAPGSTVDEGDAVTVVVATGPTRVRVPDVTKLTVAAAEKKLQRKGLTLGAVEPKLDPKAKVASQVPAAGVKRRRGSPVSVVLAKPKKKGDGKDAKDGKEGGAGAGAAGGGGGMPAVAGAGAAAVVEKLAAAGLEPKQRRQIHPSKPGTVLGTLPPAGEPPPADREVIVLVSAGFPQLAYETDAGVFVADAVFGWPFERVARDAHLTTGGAWHAAGRRLAWIADGTLHVGRPSADRTRTVRRPGRAVVQAAFAPAGSLLAFVDRPRAGGGTAPARDAICWTERAGRGEPSCRSLGDFRASGLTWRPGGEELLVAASRGERFGLLRLETRTAYSPDATKWLGGSRFATDVKRDGDVYRGVRAAAFPRRGKRLALVSNLRTPEFRLVFANPDRLKPTRRLPVPACEVAWRSDGKELAVVQGGPGCLEPTGPIVRFEPDAPRALRTVVFSGGHPAWQPIELSSGPGR